MRGNRTTKHGKYVGPLSASVHETAKGLHAAGVMDKETMRRFDIMCLTPVRRLCPNVRDSKLGLEDREGLSWCLWCLFKPEIGPKLLK